MKETDRNENRNSFNVNEFIRKDDLKTGLILFNLLSPEVFAHEFL